MTYSVTPSKELINRLIDLSLISLEAMYDRQKKLFTTQYTNKIITPMGRAGIITYTAITLIGLAKVKERLPQTPFDWPGTLASLMEQIQQLPRVGDLGLILWADAHGDGVHAREIVTVMRQQLSQRSLPDIDTMELAWLLTGLCYARSYLAEDSQLSELTTQLYQALMTHSFPQTGLFRHTVPRSLGTRLRSNIGTFADQIYPIYALAAYYAYSSEKAALDQALKCARRICQLRGNQGQWWWHYNYQTGQVAEKYPVYAVHQDGMAIMGLLKVSRVSQEDFSGPAWQGLDWLFGNNELKATVVDWERHIIWRDIERSGALAKIRYVTAVLSNFGWVGAPQLLDAFPNFVVNWESRPYHPGWLIYACADYR